MTLMQKLNARVKAKRQTEPYKGPDKSSPNGSRPLTFPTPYHGGKRRWAEEILEAFGPERECVYVEPFAGSAAVLLANPRPYAREILCDTNPHIANVFRSLAWAPEVVAFWADWPTIHQDLTARHTWLLRWAVENAAEIEANPDFHDPKAAGWWLWGKSNWIGTEFAIVRGQQTSVNTSMPSARGSSGVNAERRDLPETPDKRPQVGISAYGQGGSAQRAPDSRPAVYHQWGGGSGVSAQRDDAGLPPAPHDKRPHTGVMTGGQGVSALRKDATLPTAPDKRPIAHYSSGVSAQVENIPTAPDKRPFVRRGDGGVGCNAQTQRTYTGVGNELPTTPDKRPHVKSKGWSGDGVQVQRDDAGLPTPPDGPDKRPHTMHSGRGVSAQRADMPTAPDGMPKIASEAGGAGVQVQRNQAVETVPDAALRIGDRARHVPTAPDKRPFVQNGGGIGVSAQRDDAGLPTAPETRPFIQSKGSGGNGVQAQRQPQDSGAPLPHYDGRAYRPDDGVPVVAPPQGPIPLTGDRLRPWFQALAERLYRVIILNRGWQSGLTPTVLQQTRTARKPPVRVLLDPPYKGVGKLYGMSEAEADGLAIASWRWAVENATRPDWRIAYACREGDFDDEALALGWTCSKTNIAANHSDSKLEVVWYSPQCFDGQKVEPTEGQAAMFGDMEVA